MPGRSRDLCTIRRLRDQAAELDLYYIPSRYPNGLVEGTPHLAFTRAQAERAIEAADAALAAVRQVLAGR
ncbi:MAG: HEPN domain-containing protein [Candidatus Eisenbacteria bacterium]